MHLPTFTLLLAASGVLAASRDGVSNPHKRAAALKKKAPKLVRTAPEKRDSSANPAYLTSKTERKLHTKETCRARSAVTEVISH